LFGGGALGNCFMKSEWNFGVAAAGLIALAGCASEPRAFRDTLNEPSDRLTYLEDRRPPNPNMPRDSRELKAIPQVVQHDPAFNEPATDAAGTPAQSESGVASSRGVLLSDRVRAQLPDTDIDITSHGSAVTLKGVVESEADRTALEAAARAVEGVATVNNRLIVNPSIKP
jgi:hypothetical protein